MTLSEYIKKYRDEHGLSQRQFAQQCGVSNGYISMLENQMNPKTSVPINPTPQQLKKLAGGMGLTLHELLSSVDDMLIDLSNEKQPVVAEGLSEDELMVLRAYRSLTAEQKSFVLQSLLAAAHTQ